MKKMELKKLSKNRIIIIRMNILIKLNMLECKCILDFYMEKKIWISNLIILKIK
jgi:hypothetical protein